MEEEPARWRHCKVEYRDVDAVEADVDLGGGAEAEQLFRLGDANETGQIGAAEVPGTLDTSSVAQHE